MREEANKPMVDGMKEENEYDDNTKYETEVSLPISDGIADENLFLLRSR